MRQPFAVEQKSEQVFAWQTERTAIYTEEDTHFSNAVGKTNLLAIRVYFFVRFQVSNHQIICTITKSLCKHQVQRESLRKGRKLLNDQSRKGTYKGDVLSTFLHNRLFAYSQAKDQGQRCHPRLLLVEINACRRANQGASLYHYGKAAAPRLFLLPFSSNR
jgi:hypothetical protein